MEITITDEGEHRKQALITADWGDIQQDYDDLVADYAKGSVPGFRSGKAPKGLVERRYQRHILDDVASRCVQRITRRALTMKEMTAVGPIAINDIVIAKNHPLRFTASFTVVPDFDLPDYRAFRFSVVNDEQRRDEICQWLLENMVISVPDELVTQELSLDGQQKIKSGSSAWQAALKRVKLLLILEKVATKDGIEIEERDVQERIEKTAVEYGQNVSSLRRKLLSNGGMSRMRSLLLAERTLDYLLEICL